MPVKTLPLIKGDKHGNDVEYKDMLPVNMCAVKHPVLNASGYMTTYPGLKLHTNAIGKDRAAVYNERLGLHFRVSGDKLITIDATGNVNEIATIPGEEQVTLDGFYSFNTQGLIADKKFYLYDPVAGFRQVTDVDVKNPIDGAWIDGVYMLTDGDSIYHTTLQDEEEIDTDAFATPEFSPDPVLGIAKTPDNKILAFSRYTLEYFFNEGVGQFLFRRLPERAQKIGIISTHAKTECKGNYYIVGSRKNEDLGVYLVVLGNSKKVSTRQVDKIINKYISSELSNIKMESITEKNNTFVLIHLPEETLCFNENIFKSYGIEFAWFVLKSDLDLNLNYRAINGIYDPRLSKWIYGDKFSDKIGIYDYELATHYDTKVMWELYTPFIKLENFSIDKIELKTIPGFNIQNDATIAMSFTEDGYNYNSLYWKLYGEPLEYYKRFILRRLGYCHNWMGFKFRGVSESKMTLGQFEVYYS
jgi:hypothetical protein